MHYDAFICIYLSNLQKLRDAKVIFLPPPNGPQDSSPGAPHLLSGLVQVVADGGPKPLPSRLMAHAPSLGKPCEIAAEEGGHAWKANIGTCMHSVGVLAVMLSQFRE